MNNKPQILKTEANVNIEDFKIFIHLPAIRDLQITIPLREDIKKIFARVRQLLEDESDESTE